MSIVDTKIRHCFFEARESKKHGINELCSAISQAAIYGTTHFAAAVGKLIAEVSGVVKSQSAACVKKKLDRNNFMRVVSHEHWR